MIKDMLVHLSKSNLEETIDYIKETHNNQEFSDCNYVLTAEK